MVHDRMLQRVADVYIQKYKKDGYDAAAAYAKRVLEGEEELKEQLRDLVVKKLNPTGGRA